MKHASLKFGKGYNQMLKTKGEIISSNKETASTKSSKSKTAYMIKVLPPVEEKLKDTSVESNSLKRGPPDSLTNSQLKRGKPENKSEETSSVRKILEISRGDTIEINEEIQPTIRIGYEEDSKSNISFRTAYSQDSEKRGSNSNDSGNVIKVLPPIYNRTRKTEEFKGEYLEKIDTRGQLRNYKIQVNDKYVKIEVGGPRDTEVTYAQHFDAQDAISAAQKEIAKLISDGYRKVPSKFTFSFDISEATAGREDLIITQNPRGNGNGNRSAPSSPKHIPTYRKRKSFSQQNSPKRVNQRDLDLLAVQRDNYSQASRHSSLVASDVDDDDDPIDLSLFTDVSTRIDDVVPSTKKDLIAEPNKDRSLGKPITQPYSSVLLAQKWESEIDPTGYYMSEKLDGVRCLWTGSTMYSRNNKHYYPPKFFTKDFPGSPLDGELWIGRSTFQKCVSVVRKQTPVDNEWRLVQYLVFDAPALNLPFSKRLEKLEEFFSKIDSPYIKLHKHVICKGPEHLLEEHERVEKLGGEGMMLREPQSYYEHRRSKTLLKVKKFDDDEATVIGHEPGTGRCAGMMGAIRVRNTQGVEFSIGSGFNDAQRRRPPKIGSKVTYKYQGVSNRNIPRFPIFLRIFEEV